MNIAILSDSLFLPTGYKNQAYQLAKYLHSKGHKIFYMMNGYNGITVDYAKLEYGTELPFKMFGEMQQTYFANSMSQILKENKIDRFIILLDTFMLYQTNFLIQDTSPAKTYFWFPSDGGGGMPKNCELILKKVNVPVAMSKFGQKQVKDYYNINTEYIPHGLDTKKLFRLPENERNKFKDAWGLNGKFVIGVVARNQPRKNLDRTMKIMALVKDKIPNAILFLHLDPNDPANPNFNLLSMAKKYNIENRVMFSGMQCFKGFPENRMNEIYNLFDCFLLTTSGEGFGIPLIEAMACEVPVIATNYTTTQEIVIDNKAGLGINLSGVEEIDMFKEKSSEYDLKVMNGTMTGSWEVERGICSITDGADKIIWLYNHPEEAKKMSAHGREVVLEKYDFEKIGKMWEEILI